MQINRENLEKLLSLNDFQLKMVINRIATEGGIDPKEYERRYVMPFAPLEKVLLTCEERGLANKTPQGCWHLTPSGFLVSNSIISDLLLIQEKY